jgi:hypothetical protein
MVDMAKNAKLTDKKPASKAQAQPDAGRTGGIAGVSMPVPTDS